MCKYCDAYAQRLRLAIAGEKPTDVIFDSGETSDLKALLQAHGEWLKQFMMTMNATGFD